MSTKDAVGNGNAAMKEEAMKSLSTASADSAESSARRRARAGARREPCMLNGHSSTKGSLELGSVGKEPDVPAVRVGSTARDRVDRPSDAGAGGACWQWLRHGACGSTAGLKAGSPIACATGHAATEGCHDPEHLLTDLLSHD